MIRVARVAFRLVALLFAAALFLYFAIWFGWCGFGSVSIQHLEVANPQFTPEWTPDGKDIVFARNSFRDPNGYWESASIYSVRLDGSRLRLVTKDNDEYEINYSPDVSPDGSRIVYTATRHPLKRTWGYARNFQIETSDLDGSDRHRLTDSNYADTSPKWSPNGTRIAFVRAGYTSGGLEPGIYTMAPDGSDVIELHEFRRSSADDEGNDVLYQEHITRPAWSPDGAKLAIVLWETVYKPRYESERPGNQTVDRAALYVASADGSGSTRIFAAPNRQTAEIAGSVAWAPVGQYLAFPYSQLLNG